MRRLIIPIIFLLSIQIAFAMYGGESEVIYSFPECLNLTINVNASLPIDDGEFSFLNCTKINQSYWECDCHDDFNLTLTTEPNTVNNYFFDILYSYQREEDALGPSGGGGGSSKGRRGRTIVKEIVTKEEVTPCVEEWECTDWSECSAENIQIRECNDLNNCGTLFYKPAETKSCAYASKEGEEVTTSTSPTGLLGITGRAVTGFLKEKQTAAGVIVLVIVVVGFGFYWFIFKRKNEKKIPT